ncbi:MAG TPA: NTP transferase domain-containing protein [Mycobacterium sp.]|nr:NTP transferase domain-containing protein [Mycobacterium sp.]
MSKASSEGRSAATRESKRAVGVLLAAGAGSRFGMPKVLAEQGEWLRIAVDALNGGGCGDVVVVLGAAVVDLPGPARAVVAGDWEEGLSASLRAGLAAVDGAQYVVLHLVDTPDVGADGVRRVLDAAQAAASGLARATYGGRPGHPVVIAGRHVAALAETLEGDEGARTFLAGRDDVLAVECGDLATGVDVDAR